MPAKYNRWDPAKVLTAVKSLKKFSPGYVRDQLPGLYGAAIRYFGSWKMAVLEAGIDYDSAITRKVHGHWTRDRVLSEIAKLNEKHSSVVRKKDLSLYSAAIRIFCSWGDAIKAAGFDYELICQNHRLKKISNKESDTSKSRRERIGKGSPSKKKRLQ